MSDPPWHCLLGYITRVPSIKAHSRHLNLCSGAGLLGSVVFGQTFLAETTACRKCTTALKTDTSLAILPEAYISAEGPHFTVPTFHQSLPGLSALSGLLGPVISLGCRTWGYPHGSGNGAGSPPSLSGVRPPPGFTGTPRGPGNFQGRGKCQPSGRHRPSTGKWRWSRPPLAHRPCRTKWASPFRVPLTWPGHGSPASYNGGTRSPL